MCRMHKYVYTKKNVFIYYLRFHFNWNLIFVFVVYLLFDFYDVFHCFVLSRLSSELSTQHSIVSLPRPKLRR